MSSRYITMYHDISPDISIYRDISLNFVIFAVTNSIFERFYHKRNMHKNLPQKFWSTKFNSVTFTINVSSSIGSIWNPAKLLGYWNNTIIERNGINYFANINERKFRLAKRTRSHWQIFARSSANNLISRFRPATVLLYEKLRGTLSFHLNHPRG